MRVVIAQCTNAKREDGDVARRLYDDSDYFRKQRDYADVVADEWFIQSAKFGLLRPDEYANPYDKHAKELDDPDAWAEEIADGLEAEVPPEATVDVLGGAAYADPLTPELETRGYDVHEPLRGLGIGERKAELVRLTRAHQNEVIR